MGAAAGQEQAEVEVQCPRAHSDRIQGLARRSHSGFLGGSSRRTEARLCMNPTEVMIRTGSRSINELDTCVSMWVGSWRPWLWRLCDTHENVRRYRLFFSSAPQSSATVMLVGVLSPAGIGTSWRWKSGVKAPI